MKKQVTVEFLYNGEIRENENERGVLIGNKVLVAGNGEIGLYNAQATAIAGVYLVDLDNDGCDIFPSNPTLIFDIIGV
jgi:threonine dehydrogenase-like Zn-dependent dehydrogenase